MSTTRRKTFDNGKAQCLGKRDKSFAGRIDVKAVEICSVINEREEFYTLSSCSGRCFLYQGHGIKSSTFLEGQENSFRRWRISHDLLKEAGRYFDLSTLSQDPTGGGDPIRTIGQFDHAEQLLKQDPTWVDHTDNATPHGDEAIWLRFEPFILHVCCRSLTAASALMAAARPSFKNVGLTTWKEDGGKYIVAIWGDEGLDMPLCTPDGTALFANHVEWLQQMVNERHERNWAKIQRFVQGVRAIAVDVVDQMDDSNDDEDINDKITESRDRPTSFDVVGDIAVIHSLPCNTSTYEDKLRMGEAIMKKNKSLKVVALRSNSLNGTERSPGNLEIIAGAQRYPLITTHTEFGIKCVVDLNHCFFSPRMAQERLRICQQVARGENVLVLFSGVGMEAVQLAGRTEASSVLAIELNPVGIKCSQLAHRMLERNKAVKTFGAAARLQFLEGDVLDILPTLTRNHYDRVLAPRPKEGKLDGDLGNGDFGASFLDFLLPIMKESGSECHWYDFASDIEFPACERTKRTIEDACKRQKLSHQVIHVANAGSVARRQLRVCVDFRLCGKNS